MPDYKKEIIKNCNKEEIDSKLSYSEKKLIYQHGRTEKELHELADILYSELCVNGNDLGITLAECRYMVKYRVIGETWNGIILQEKNTISKLSEKFPHLIFEKTSEIEDLKYEVDYEVYFEGALICGLQIKPITYKKANTPEVNETRIINEKKNEKYLKDKNVSVIYIYSDKEGNIEDIDNGKDYSLNALMAKAIFLGA